MKYTALLPCLFLLTIGLSAQNTNFQITVDFSPSHSLLKLENENAQSLNYSGHFGFRYYFKKIYLHGGAGYLSTAYHTELVQKRYEEYGGVSTSRSTVDYRNLTFPIGIGFLLRKNFNFQLAAIQVYHLNASTNTYWHQDYYDEITYTLDAVSGKPKEFSLMFGASLEYALVLSERIDFRFGIRAMTSGVGILKNEKSLSRFSDFGGSVGLAYKI